MEWAVFPTIWGSERMFSIGRMLMCLYCMIINEGILFFMPLWMFSPVAHSLWLPLAKNFTGNHIMGEVALALFSVEIFYFLLLGHNENNLMEKILKSKNKKEGLEHGQVNL